MKNVFRLKTELYWILKEDYIEFFGKNDELNRKLCTDDIEGVFDFLEYISEGRTNEEIASYNSLSNEEKMKIIEYLEKNKYAIWMEDHSIGRSEAFINSIPNVNFQDYKEKIEMTNILIIGVGTATSYVLEILSKLGIKKFTLIDGDQVEKRNLEAQNYSNDDIGNYKVRSLEKKYGRHMELKIFTQYVQSIYELELLVELNDYDYIINGADQISLMIGLIEAKIKQKFNGILIEGGYGVLNQNIYMIDNIESALEIQRSLKEFSSGNKRWIVDNNGSIFNSIFSAFSISKLIFDKILSINDTKIAFGDFLQNRYFVGGKYEKIMYEDFSDSIQNNMNYKRKVNNKTEHWIPKINKRNVLSIHPNYDVTSSLSAVEKEFLLRKGRNDFIQIAEFKQEKLVISSLSLTEDNEQKIINRFFSFILENFGEDIHNRVASVHKNGIITEQSLNRKQQNKTIFIRDQWIVFNTQYSSDFERIIGEIHELLHIVFWNITNDPYEHERFVMEWELRFFEVNNVKGTISHELCKYYLKTKMILFVKNYAISHYEKAVITDTLPRFQIDFNDLTKYRLDSFVKVLNQQIHFEKPFYLLKYLQSFERNQYYFEKILNEELSWEGNDE
ncbi:hypothetical protein IGI65_000624 [Enterococcus sp. DIV0755b]|uniref:ThiF family adenylyltransferase n=1 Tax=Enterococcus sp. DIV0755b TaxID=2774657 RepID=UPI003F20D91A